MTLKVRLKPDIAAKYALTCLLLIVLGLSPVARAGDPTGPVPGKFIVKLKPTVRPAMLSKSLSSAASFTKASRLVLKSGLKDADNWNRFYIYTTPDKSTTASDVVRQLGSGNVEYVEQDYYIQFFDFPTDSLFPDQWYLYNNGQEYLGIDRYQGNNNDSLVLKSGIAGKDIRLVNYYGSAPAEHTSVVVAIIDTGVDLHHPELEGQFWKNPGEIPGNGIDDDHNGFIDDTLGYDVSGDQVSVFNPVGDNDPTDHDGHGTHLAGLVAAKQDGKGIVGVDPYAKIMAVKIRPNATNAVAAAGIMYAVNAGAQVINISWGTPFESGILREALTFARANNVFVSIAAGNSGGTDRYYPAAFDSSFVVAAGNSDGFLTYFTTYGAHIDIVAPGQDILSLRAAGTDLYAAGGEPGIRIIGPDSLYYLADGTSMASPITAGAAALILSLHPQLPVAELEQALLNGATDMVDPFDRGDSLVGPDTLSGYGYLNVDASLNLLAPLGLKFSSPTKQERYTSDVPIVLKPTGGYSGHWLLEYAKGAGNTDWQPLDSGTVTSPDSVVTFFTDTTVEGIVNLRATIDGGKATMTDFVHSRRDMAVITSPASGERTKYDIPIYGSVHGPTYDSMSLSYIRNGTRSYLTTATGEFYDSLLYQWTLSGIDTGLYKIVLAGYFTDTTMIDTVSVYLQSAFALGWPRTLGSKAGISPVCADLNHDGINELIVCAGDGVYAFHPDGSMLPGFPALSGSDMRCMPAIYDVDRDGIDDIVCSSSDGLYVVKYDGTMAEGWPTRPYTGLIPFGYSYPNPTVTRLGVDQDSAVVMLNKIGQIMAYRFTGESYFYSLQGLFASFDPRISDSYGYGGGTSPFVTSADLLGNGQYEVIGSYTSPQPYNGVGIFDGRTGQPAFGRTDPLVINTPLVYGTALADMNGDSLLDIITLGSDTAGIPHLWVRDAQGVDLPGWPRAMSESKSWIGSYPVLADLDLDGMPEILCTFFEFDIARLYIWRADGTPYHQQSGAPQGVAFSDAVTFGTPTVANLTGDDYPEIVFRSGYVLPNTGPERVYILDHNAQLLPGWPATTPARNYEVFSSRFAPLVTDLDGDGKVELILNSDNRDVLVWNFDASSDNGKNVGKFLADNLNTNTFRSTALPTGIDNPPGVLPATMQLAQNYPNPFNPTTTIDFQLPRKEHVSIDIFNILGQRVTQLVDETLPAGSHSVVFDGSSLASGVYLYRLATDKSQISRKMVMIK
jgi:subtilisin family serine protease